MNRVSKFPTRSSDGLQSGQKVKLNLIIFPAEIICAWKIYPSYSYDIGVCISSCHSGRHLADEGNHNTWKFLAIPRVKSGEENTRVLVWRRGLFLPCVSTSSPMPDLEKPANQTGSKVRGSR